MIDKQKEILKYIVDLLETGTEVISFIPPHMENNDTEQVANLINDLCSMYDVIIESVKQVELINNEENFINYSLKFEETLKAYISMYEKNVYSKTLEPESYNQLIQSYIIWKSNIQFEIIKILEDANFRKSTMENLHSLQSKKNNPKRILIGSPINQKPHILKEFLSSIKSLDMDDLFITFLFIDDNKNEESSLLLNEFSEVMDNVIIHKSDKQDDYLCDEHTHRWKENLIWKVANFKDLMIKVVLDNNFDYLFLIDSDIILHPNTLKHLVSTKKEIISEIFWTKWNPNMPELPQVWLGDQYNLYHKNRNEIITQNEMLIRQHLFISNLRKPGIYQVGGLGACTLISKDALKTGINFSEIKNLSFWGEDRHFCVRAAALGIPLFVDTHYPAYHIYRDSDLLNLEKNAPKRNEYIPLEDHINTSRFFKEYDSKAHKFVFDLPRDWWSRFYEYEWASNFVEPDDVSLDAACGLAHPLKFYLNQNCKKTYACDIDERIIDPSAIVKEISEVYGVDYHESNFKEIEFSKASLTKLPYTENKFNKIYCISVLEHLTKEDIKKSFREFRRILKDNGKVILTFDFPTIDLDFLLKVINDEGFKFEGEVDIALSKESLYTTLWEGLCCFRAILVKNENYIIEKTVEPEFKYKKWWEHNYAVGGTSGAGSYGKLAEFKAEVINSFIKNSDISNVIEFGCGDGNQLTYMDYNNYLGFDIADSALKLCKEKFMNDETKSFELYDIKNFNSKNYKAELVVCLDVLYHIINDYDFERTLDNIFTCSSKYVILYTRITSDNECEIAPTIKDRDIIKHLKKYNNFKIMDIIKQRYPTESTADFILLERIEQ